MWRSSREALRGFKSIKGENEGAGRVRVLIIKNIMILTLIYLFNNSLNIS